MMWPVLFKLQRRSRSDDAAVVSCLKNKHLQNAGEESNLLAAHVRPRDAIKGLCNAKTQRRCHYIQINCIHG